MRGFVLVYVAFCAIITAILTALSTEKGMTTLGCTLVSFVFGGLMFSGDGKRG